MNKKLKRREKNEYYHYTNADAAIKILETAQIRFSRICKVNDPFDTKMRISLTDDFETNKFINLFKNALLNSHSFNNIFIPYYQGILGIDSNIFHREEKVYKLQEYLNRNFLEHTQPITEKHDRVFCCSNSYDIPSMWAHYGENYGGVVIEFHDPLGKNVGIFNVNSIKLDGENVRTAYLKKITYSDIDPVCFNEKEIIHWFKAMEANIIKSNSNTWVTENIAKPCYFKKSRHWNYEQEHRFLRFLPSDHLQIGNEYYFEEILSDNVKRVIFGHLIKPWYEEYIKKLLYNKYPNTALEKINGFKHRYKFIIENINNNQ